MSTESTLLTMACSALCGRRLRQVVSLVDALGKNESLERLDLSLAGFEWMPPVKREERSALSTLLTVMNGDAKALEALETLVISQKTLYEIPVGALRSGPEKVRRAAALCTPRAHLVHTSSTPRAHLVHTSCTPRSHLVHTSCTPRAHSPRVRMGVHGRACACSHWVDASLTPS